MNKILVGLTLLTQVSFLPAQNEDLSKKANALFEAGEYEKAITSYKELLESQNEGIKKEILTYNLGTAYLVEGQPQKAIEHFFKIVNSDKQVPKHLLERTHYNLILGHLDLADHALDHLDEDSPMTSVRDAQRSLVSAQERYLAYIEIKYPYLTDYEEMPQELLDLKHSIKELNSKMKRIEKRVYLESLSFKEGLQNLLTQAQNRLLYLDAYLQTELKKDFKKHLLNKQYISEKTSIPFWEKMKEIIQSQFDEAEKKVSYKDTVSQQQDDHFQLQSTFLTLFDQAHNRHQLCLDHLKDRNLFNGRLEYAKAHLDLKLMELTDQEKDSLDYCLMGKINLREKQDVYREKERFTRSLKEELAHYNVMATGLTTHINEKIQAFKSESRDKKGFSKLDELKKVDELDVVQQLLLLLKTRLETEVDPTLDKLMKDYYLYHLTKQKPENLLVKAYQRFKEQEKIEDKELDLLDHQFFAVLNYLEIQHKFSYEPEKNKRIEYALTALPEVKKHLSEKEIAQATDLLKKVLINWNYNRFMASELEENLKSYPLILDQISFSKEEVEQLSLQNQQALASKEQLQDPASHQETLDYLEEEMSKIEQSHELALEDSFKNQTQKLILKSGAEGLKRIIRHLKDEKLTSKEILTLGLNEEKTALSFSKNHRKEISSNQEACSKLETLAGESQNFPLETVASFIDTFYDEEAEKSAQSNQATKNSEVLKFFKAGQAEAESAQRQIEKEDTNWDEVITKQQLAIDYWEKALQSYQNSSQNQKQEDNQNNSNSGGGGGPQEEDKLENQGEGGGEKNLTEMAQGEEGASKESELRDILQKLQEMQQDDQIRAPQQHKPKQGLRPW